MYFKKKQLFSRSNLKLGDLIFVRVAVNSVLGTSHFVSDALSGTSHVLLWYARMPKLAIRALHMQEICQFSAAVEPDLSLAGTSATAGHQSTLPNSINSSISRWNCFTNAITSPQKHNPSRNFSLERNGRAKKMCFSNQKIAKRLVSVLFSLVCGWKIDKRGA